MFDPDPRRSYPGSELIITQDPTNPGKSIRVGRPMLDANGKPLVDEDGKQKFWPGRRPVKLKMFLNHPIAQRAKLLKVRVAMRSRSYYHERQQANLLSTISYFLPYFFPSLLHPVYSFVDSLPYFVTRLQKCCFVPAEKLFFVRVFPLFSLKLWAFGSIRGLRT